MPSDEFLIFEQTFLPNHDPLHMKYCIKKLKKNK